MNADVHHIPIQYRKLSLTSQTSSEFKYFLHEYGVKFNSIYDLVSYYLRNPLSTKSFSLKHLGPPVKVCVLNTHENIDWFYKEMDQKKSEMILNKVFINGLFLGRYKDETCSEFVISFRHMNQVKHCCIKRQDGFLTVANIKFQTLEELVRYYGKNKFYEDVKLLHPLTKRLNETTIDNDVCAKMK